MTRDFLIRGLLAGVLAGVLAFCFARVFGEPQVNHAIAFETWLDQQHGEPPDPEIFSRVVQRGIGLLTATVVYCTGLGGLFSLVFAAAYGRVRLSPRALSALIAGAGFVAMVLVPQLKYPANPPSVGMPETIGMRTALYFEMIFISVCATVLACLLGRWLGGRIDRWGATLLSALCFVVVITAVQWALPDVSEVPPQFPAVVLWRFRVAAMGTQLVLWTTLGLAFGYAAEYRLRRIAAAARPAFV